MRNAKLGNHLNVFPSREIVQLHLPECFLKKYSTTTLIIDATEIYIEKPNNPEVQQVTFSSYKNSNTLKALKLSVLVFFTIVLNSLLEVWTVNPFGSFWRRSNSVGLEHFNLSYIYIIYLNDDWLTNGDGG